MGGGVHPVALPLALGEAVPAVRACFCAGSQGGKKMGVGRKGGMHAPVPFPAHAPHYYYRMWLLSYLIFNACLYAGQLVLYTLLFLPNGNQVR